jgi:hypothetical protein
MDTVLTYSVRACNSFGCSQSPAVVARTIPRTPTDLRLFITNPNAAAFTLVWQDRSNAETRFDIEIGDSDFFFTKYADVGAGVTFFSTTVGFSELLYFWVMACNDAGCSQPSNYVSVYFPPPSNPAAAASSRRRGGSRE